MTLTQTLTVRHVLETARELNEPGEVNAEYVRGQANLISDLFGLAPNGLETGDLLIAAITHVITVDDFLMQLAELVLST